MAPVTSIIPVIAAWIVVLLWIGLITYTIDAYLEMRKNTKR